MFVIKQGDRLPSLEATIRKESDGTVVDLTTDDAGPAIATIVAAAAHDGIAITGIEVHEPNLEAVFLHLTGKALRDRAE